MFVAAAVVVPFATGCAGSDPSDRASRSTGGTGPAGASKSSGSNGSSGPSGSSGTRSTGSSGGTGAASPSIKVTCEWRRDFHRSDEADCECRSEGGTGDKFEVSGGCWEHPDDPTISCADPDFPRSGSCSYWELYPWRCSNASGGSSCECGFTSFQAGSSALYCDTQAFNGSAYCCLSGQTCTCRSGTGMCNVGEQAVTDCASGADALGLPEPPTTCPSDQVQVASCNVANSDSPSSSAATDTELCPGVCTGESVVCCPNRKSDGSCGTLCCADSGCF